jgi:hypothetical protein
MIDWKHILSLQTARFMLGMLALTASVGCTIYVMGYGLKEATENAVMFAFGQMFALTIAFNYYFGSTARGDQARKPSELENTP